MEVLPQLVLNTLQIGSVYVLFALGLTLIFGVMRIINFAHAEFFTLAALVVAVVMGWAQRTLQWPLWLEYTGASAAALVVVVVLGAVLYQLAFRRYLRDLVAGFILSLGLVLLLQGAMFEVFGGLPHEMPVLVPGNTRIFGATMTNQRLLLCALSLTIAVLLYLMIRHTRLGLGLRAMAEDHEAAMLQGMPYKRIALYGFLIGLVLAALAGCLVAPLTAVVPTLGADYLIKAFMIVIVGGLGSLPGAVVASFIIAFIESSIGFVWDLSTATIVMFVVVIGLLLVRPQGLFGYAER
jgi:branched-chain amino acid transport system permease protein